MKAAMEWLAAKPGTLFIGQGVLVTGTGMSSSFADIATTKRIEFPVAEELQLGYAIGLSMTGYNPICVFPRWNFMLRAADQLVNHLDRIPLYSGFRPRVIIRTAVGKTKPLDPGQQHADDLGYGFCRMLKTVRVVRVWSDDGLAEYQEAWDYGFSTILVE